VIAYGVSGAAGVTLLLANARRSHPVSYSNNQMSVARVNDIARAKAGITRAK
jgi:hypothetical protein